MRKDKGQLCWKCSKACDDSLCEWVRKCQGTNDSMQSVDYPDYVKTETIVRDKYNRGVYVGVETTTYIVGCDNFEWDGKSK